MVGWIAATIWIFRLTRPRPVPRRQRDLARRVEIPPIRRERDGDRGVADVESRDPATFLEATGARLSEIDDENRRATLRRGEEIAVVGGDVGVDEPNRRPVA